MCSVLNCPQLEGLPLGAYNPIVEAFTAGDIAKALELVDSSRLATAKAETAAQQPSPAPLQLLSAPAPVNCALSLPGICVLAIGKDHVLACMAVLESSIAPVPFTEMNLYLTPALKSRDEVCQHAWLPFK